MIIKVSSDLEDILPKYLQNRKQEVEELKSFLANKDFESLKVRGHRLAGNAPSYGMELLGSLGVKIEADAKREDLSNMGDYIQEIEEFLIQVEVEYVDDDEDW
ncbi:MAG: histidine phosphotransferase [Halobacteriovoraceae bacterium]|nr:histidine phosphotransferase [Halobacteriovoraceae bacterium]|tara:strand:+ start:280557 stop:280865 length:309 start_codon:yes stop_codon:yes gene_type:complete